MLQLTDQDVRRVKEIEAWKEFENIGWQAARMNPSSDDLKLRTLLGKTIIEVVQAGDTVRFERLNIALAAKDMLEYSKETKRELPDDEWVVYLNATRRTAYNCKDPDVALSFAKRHECMSQELLKKHAPHSNDPITCMLGMLIQDK